ncbi:hypothetical protein NAF19_18405 [Mucilaginibacter sp. RT5R15]|nr:hypothetical protein [Mucilaginibacter flavidus]
MVMYSDIEYKATKLIKQGKEAINSDFVQLANWIDETYDVKTMNIIYDTIKADNRPRLQIIFENAVNKFSDNLKQVFNFNEEKQHAIGNQFKEIVSSKRDARKWSILNFFKKDEYQTEGLFVVFSAFEPIAKVEVIEKIPKSRIKELKAQIGNSDIWEVITACHTAIFFFYTENQVEENANNGVKEHLSKLFFPLLKPFDEFNYFKEQDYSISLDSKENFDKNYEGNWYYYFK